MIKFTLAGTVAILSTVITTPIVAQTAMQDSGVYAFHHPSADLGP